MEMEITVTPAQATEPVTPGLPILASRMVRERIPTVRSLPASLRQPCNALNELTLEVRVEKEKD